MEIADAELTRASEILSKSPGMGRIVLARTMKIDENRARTILNQLGATQKRCGPSIVDARTNDADNAILAALKGKRRKFTIRELSDRLDRSEHTCQEAIERLKKAGHNIVLEPGGECSVSAAIPCGTPEPIVHSRSEYHHAGRKFGVCGDKHLCNRQSRLDVMNALYDTYAEEGVTEVYDTGNWIDGECRFNKQELIVWGLDNQIDYWIENHPQRKGVTTYFVAGDDHEGWYQQRECIEIGRYAESRAHAAGRDDLRYLGYLEADVQLAVPGGAAWMKVMHPGGGAAYALSYTGQKAAEAFQGGEKPAILLQGHFHKVNFGFPREIYVIDTGTCCDQTIFMRKKRIQAHVGGWLIELNQATDGHINRFKPEFFHFYDRGYYTGKLRKFAGKAA